MSYENNDFFATFGTKHLGEAALTKTLTEAKTLQLQNKLDAKKRSIKDIYDGDTVVLDEGWTGRFANVHGGYSAYAPEMEAGNKGLQSQYAQYGYLMGKSEEEINAMMRMDPDDWKEQYFDKTYTSMDDYDAQRRENIRRETDAGNIYAEGSGLTGHYNRELVNVRRKDQALSAVDFGIDTGAARQQFSTSKDYSFMGKDGITGRVGNVAATAVNSIVNKSAEVADALFDATWAGLAKAGAVSQDDITLFDNLKKTKVFESDDTLSRQAQANATYHSKKGNYVAAFMSQAYAFPETLAKSAGEMALLALGGKLGLAAAVGARVNEQAEEFKKNNNNVSASTERIGTMVLSNSIALMLEQGLLKGAGKLWKSSSLGDRKAFLRMLNNNPGFASSLTTGGAIVGGAGLEAVQETFDQWQEMMVTRQGTHQYGEQGYGLGGFLGIGDERDLVTKQSMIDAAIAGAAVAAPVGAISAGAKPAVQKIAETRHKNKLIREDATAAANLETQYDLDQARVIIEDDYNIQSQGLDLEVERLENLEDLIDNQREAIEEGTGEAYQEAIQREQEMFGGESNILTNANSTYEQKLDILMEMESNVRKSIRRQRISLEVLEKKVKSLKDAPDIKERKTIGEGEGEFANIGEVLEAETGPKKAGLSSAIKKLFGKGKKLSKSEVIVKLEALTSDQLNELLKVDPDQQSIGVKDVASDALVRDAARSVIDNRLKAKNILYSSRVGTHQDLSTTEASQAIGEVIRAKEDYDADQKLDEDSRNPELKDIDVDSEIYNILQGLDVKTIQEISSDSVGRREQYIDEVLGAKYSTDPEMRKLVLKIANSINKADVSPSVKDEAGTSLDEQAFRVLKTVQQKKRKLLAIAKNQNANTRDIRLAKRILEDLIANDNITEKAADHYRNRLGDLVLRNQTDTEKEIRKQNQEFRKIQKEINVLNQTIDDTIDEKTVYTKRLQAAKKELKDAQDKLDRQIQEKENISKAYNDFITIVKKVAEAVRKILSTKGLIDTKQKEIQHIEKMIQQLNDYEAESKTKRKKKRAQLESIKESYRPFGDSAPESTREPDADPEVDSADPDLDGDAEVSMDGDFEAEIDEKDTEVKEEDC